MPYVKSSSGAVVRTVRTAISAPVFACSSVSSAVSRVRTSAGSAPARSVTKPRGVGIAGSSARATGAAASTASATTSVASLCTEPIHRGDDALDVAEIAGELVARLAAREPPRFPPALENAAKGGQGAEQVLAGREHVGVRERRLVALEMQQMAEDHEERRDRAREELLDVGRARGGVEVAR